MNGGLDAVVRPLVGVVGRGVVDADEPVAFGDDLGLLRGDGCFDATLVRTGADGISTVDHLDRHLARLRRSAQLMGIPLEAAPSDQDWRTTVEAVLAAWTSPGEGVMKLVLTHGREFDASAPPYAQVVVAPLGPAIARERQGLHAVTLTRGYPLGVFAGAPWLLGGVKSVSYAVHLAARREAESRGADDALFVTTDGYALEGPTSALVWARDGALLSTRHGDTGVLASITQEVIFENAAAQGMTCGYDVILAADLGGVDGAWLVSSGRGAAPIMRLNGAEQPFDQALHDRVAGFAWG